MAIFTHLVVGTNDLEKARDFYDRVLGTIGLKRIVDTDIASVWGKDALEFMVTTPRNGQPATSANGGTISFAAGSRGAVDAFHMQALASGGICEGPPGPRGQNPMTYGAYVRDLDGNKLAVFSFVSE